MSQRSPGLQETLASHFDYATANMYTAIPGVVVTVKNLGTLTVDVQPAINMRSHDGLEVVERPPILNVPLQMPVSKEGGLTFPISSGTPVWLLFSMRGLENWKRTNGYPASPSDIRRFDVRDCVAIPGTYPFSVSPNDPDKRSNPHDPNDVVLVHNIGTSAEVEIRLKVNGDVIINSPGKVEINSKSLEVNSDEVNITTSSYTVETGTYSLSVTESAAQTGVMAHNGSFVLNGIPLETHKHDGVVAGAAKSGGPTT